MVVDSLIIIREWNKNRVDRNAKQKRTSIKDTLTWVYFWFGLLFIHAYLSIQPFSPYLYILYIDTFFYKILEKKGLYF